MSLAKCKTCGGRVSMNASACPHCGEPNPVDVEQITFTDSEIDPLVASTIPQRESISEKNVSAKQVVLVIFLAVILIAMWVASQSSSSNQPRSTSQPRKTDAEIVARVGAEDIITQNLKAPSTAKFINMRILERSGNWFLMAADVDAQNSFGAMIRNRFHIILRVEGERYHWKRQVAAIEGSFTSSELETFKTINGWGE